MGIFSKFRKGLKKTRTEGITAQLDDVMESHQEITDDLYDELEEVLIMGDVGIPTAQRVIRDLKAKIENDKITSVPQVRETMKDIVSGIVWGRQLSVPAHQALCDFGHRRERCRQDHHHRQTGSSAEKSGP